MSLKTYSIDVLLASTSNFFPCLVWFDWVDKCYIVTDKRLNGWIRKEAMTGMCVSVLCWGTSTNYTSKCYMGKESGSIESKVDFTVASKGDWLLLPLWLFPMRMFQITVFHSRQGEVNFGNLGIPRFTKLIDLPIKISWNFISYHAYDSFIPLRSVEITKLCIWSVAWDYVPMLCSDFIM